MKWEYCSVQPVMQLEEDDQLWVGLFVDYFGGVVEEIGHGEADLVIDGLQTTYTATLKAIHDKVSSLGLEGWEVISVNMVYPLASSEIRLPSFTMPTFYLKRPIVE